MKLRSCASRVEIVGNPSVASSCFAARFPLAADIASRVRAANSKTRHPHAQAFSRSLHALPPPAVDRLNACASRPPGARSSRPWHRRPSRRRASNSRMRAVTRRSQIAPADGSFVAATAAPRAGEREFDALTPVPTPLPPLAGREIQVGPTNRSRSEIRR